MSAKISSNAEWRRRQGLILTLMGALALGACGTTSSSSQASPSALEGTATPTNVETPEDVSCPGERIVTEAFVDTNSPGDTDGAGAEARARQIFKSSERNKDKAIGKMKAVQKDSKKADGKGEKRLFFTDASGTTVAMMEFTQEHGQWYFERSVTCN